MRICVTGSEGYIGSALCERLKQEHDLFYVDLRAPAAADVIHLDVHDRIASFQPTVVFNLAGVSGERWCTENRERAWWVNAVTPSTLRKAVKGAVFVQASSASVLNNRGMDETPYAHAKEWAENCLIDLALPKTYILRFGTVYGYNATRMRWDTPFNKMVLDAVTKGEITVHGPARMRPWVALDGLVDRLEAIVDDAESGVAHGWEFPLPVVDFNMSLGQVARFVQMARPDAKIFTPPGGDGDTRDYCMPALESVPYAWGGRLDELIKGAIEHDSAV